MTLSLFAMVALSLGVAALLRVLEGQPVDGALVRRDLVPVGAGRCLVRATYRFTVDGAVYEHVLHSDVVRRDDEVALRGALRSLPSQKRLRHLAEAPELHERADGVAVPVAVRKGR